jgi:carbon-monoxide dehydrogenase large subunit
MKAFGARVKRKEDPALLKGRGRYVADIQLPGMLHAAFVRSPYAHARLLSIDISAALALPGVHAVYTHADLPPELQGKRLPLPVPNPVITQPFTYYALARDEVCHVGETVAVVLAESRYVAEDGTNLVKVAYDPLPAASDCRAALAADAPLAHAGSEDNVASSFTVGFGAVEEAFNRAAHVFRERLFQHRGCGQSMECRGVVASHDPVQDTITVWTATQAPHNVKRMLVDVLGRSEDSVRVVAPPDVGGGFGPKGIAYPEEAVIASCATVLGRPVKWIEDRCEHFVATTQERDQYWDVEIAVNAEARIMGVRGSMVHDAGAYLPWGIITPYISATTMPGPYVIPAYQLDVTVALTNKTPTTPVRGAGRPQAVFAMERLMDRVAKGLGLDPAEVRRRNFVRPDQMPYPVGLIYRDGSPVTYDSGDYPACQKETLESADYDGFPARKAAARREGRLLGIGIANYVEGTGLGPFEGASVRVTHSGKILVYTGAAPQGQGHATTLAQICADQLGVGVEDVSVVTGDTAKIAMGIGTFASRSAVNAGSSTYLAAKRVRERVVEMASHLLEVSRDDLELGGGRVYVKGTPSKGFHLGELARLALGSPGFSLPGGMKPGLEVTEYFTPSQSAYSNGTHVAEVEVDPETGEVQILRYTVGHDCGRVINPLVVDGQVLGGVAHGIGNALYERMLYDADVLPLTLTLQDYLLPVAGSVPSVDLVHLETPSPLNPLGVKGAGEGGTIPVAAAVVAAIEDALESFGVHLAASPATPQMIAELLEAKTSEAALGEYVDKGGVQ